MGIITKTLDRIKQAGIQALEADAIKQACRDEDHSWNDSTLNPIVVVQLLFNQVLRGNTAITHLSHLYDKPFTSAAYCKARMRLPLAVLRRLLTQQIHQLKQNAFDNGLWHGHRVFHVDGSSFSMPDTPALQKRFGQPNQQKPGCGFPVASWLVLTHAATGMINKMFASPLDTHDMSKVTKLHPELRPGDVMVADRGFCSYAHLALHLERGTEAVFRLASSVLVDFTPGRVHASATQGSKTRKGVPRSRWIKKLGHNDQVVQWIKGKRPPAWMSQEQFDALPNQITVRELRYQVQPKGYRSKQITLVTTLVDAEPYTADDLATLYGQRWQIETHFKSLKTTMGMNVLKCKTPEGVLRELHAFALIYNLVRQVMLESARRQQVDPLRISFVDALRWLKEASPIKQLDRLVVNPLRPGRYEPRVKKRRNKKHTRMTKPRQRLKQAMAA